MSRLDEIIRYRREDIARGKAEHSLSEMARLARLAPAPLNFVEALDRPRQAGRPGPALIAEIKRASPSRGDLAPGLDALELARRYTDCGVAAISVLTESRHFKGSMMDLRRVAAAGLGVPLLRKDFILDAWQVYEARLAGADAVLLIVACLEAAQLAELHSLITELNMTALVEVHNRAELEAALACEPELIGINNRDLATFQVDLATTVQLRPLAPAGVRVVAESGIHTPEDVRCLHEAGVDAVLVGEALVTAANLEDRVRSLAGAVIR